MKLVDLDEIECFYLVDKEGKVRYKIEIGEGLPTVKAIPIEWINRWLDASRTNGLSIDVDTMLHDWEVMEGRK